MRKLQSRSWEFVDRHPMLETGLQHLRHTAQRLHQRRLIVVAGDMAWCHSQAQSIVSGDSGMALWIGEKTSSGIPVLPAERCHKVLGRELDLLIFDAHAGFDPDAFGAALGAVRGGGLIVLLAPRLTTWPRFADPQNRRIAVAGYDPDTLSGRYVTRLIRVLQEDPTVWWLFEGEAITPPPMPSLTGNHAIGAEPPPVPPPCRTDDQAQAVAAILHTANGHRRRPAVLTADRGRGKSAAMGIAAAQLMQQRDCTIVVTAPRRDAAEPLFAMCEKLLAQHPARGGVLEFQPPDELVHHARSADLLMVDEAAGIPAPLLAQLLARYPRIVFATTVHGYEGTGRGFALRFQQLLDRETPDWQAVALNTPIRWSADDPVEALTFRALLMDARAVDEETIAAAEPDACPVDFLDRDELIHDEPLLRELFGLLVNAHYRTTPLDLRHLLDGPNLTLAVQRYRGHVVATALVAREGGFDAAAAHAIWTGRRRPHGHLLAQSLAAYLGIEAGPQLLGARVLRIAVHPALQRRGFGRRLIGELVATSRAQGLDYLGSSFGATPELLRFWLACGCRAIRIGHRREASSGQHSALVLQPLSDAGQDLFDQTRERYRRNLHVGLSSTLADLEAELITFLLEETTPLPTEELQAQDWRDLVAFAFALRGYESAQAAVESFVTRCLSDPDLESRLAAEERALLTFKVIQRHGWTATVKQLELGGRREAVEKLRLTLQTFLKAVAEPWLSVLIEKTGIQKQR